MAVTEMQADDELCFMSTLLAGGADVVKLVEPLVRPDVLTMQRVREAYVAALALAHAGGEVDSLRIADHIGVRWHEVEELADYPTTDPKWIASRLRAAHDRRVLAQTLAKAQQLLLAPTADAVTVASELAGELALTAARRTGQKGFRSAQGTGDWRELVDELASPPPKDGMVGVPFGWKSIDRYTGGVLPGELVVFSAAPGGGKTVSLVNIASHNAVKRGRPVGFVSAEMTRKALWRRVLCDLAEIDTITMRRRDFAPGQVARLIDAMNDLEAAPLYIDETPAPSIADIFARTRALKAQHPDLAALCVDYAQLIDAQAENRAETIRAVLYGLKALAKELQVPVFTAAQLNDKETERGGTLRKPSLADLQGSSGIRQAADIVFMQYPDGGIITLDGQKFRELAPKRFALRPELQYQRLVDDDLSHTAPFGGHA